MQRADFWEERALLTRLVTALIVAQSQLDPTDWDETTRIDESAGFDSLSRLNAVATLNRFFNLSATGVEDYLLVQRRLGDWLDLISEAMRLQMQNGVPVLRFATSGSTAAPEIIEHPLPRLVEELGAVATRLPPVRRIISIVSPHHIFGFLYTILLPKLLSLPSLDLRSHGPGTIVKALHKGDLLVATPFHWQALQQAGEPFAKGCHGLSSTAPMPPDLHRKLSKNGVETLTEVYGSTQTSGIGTRMSPHQSFTLLPHLNRGADGLYRITDPNTCLDVQDNLTWHSPTQFHVNHRLDGAIQIGGNTVQPMAIRDWLIALDAVSDAVVRPEGSGAAMRLKAFVVPSRQSIDDLEAALHALAAEQLSPAERPVSYAFGSELPVNGMGKPTDWQQP